MRLKEFIPLFLEALEEYVEFAIPRNLLCRYLFIICRQEEEVCPAKLVAAFSEIGDYIIENRGGYFSRKRLLALLQQAQTIGSEPVSDIAHLFYRLLEMHRKTPPPRSAWAEYGSLQKFLDGMLCVFVRQLADRGPYIALCDQILSATKTLDIVDDLEEKIRLLDYLASDAHVDLFRHKIDSRPEYDQSRLFEEFLTLVVRIEAQLSVRDFRILLDHIAHKGALIPN